MKPLSSIGRFDKIKLLMKTAESMLSKRPVLNLTVAYFFLLKYQYIDFFLLLCFTVTTS